MAEDTIPVILPNGDEAYVPSTWTREQVKSFMDRITASPHYQASTGVDKYHEAARRKLAEEKARGGVSYMPQFAQDIQRLVSQGQSFGWLDEATALARSGLDPYSENYKYEKALIDERKADAEHNTGLLGKVAEILGGVQTGTVLNGAGLTLMGEGMSFLPRIAAGAAEGAGYGAVTGAGNAQTGQRADGAMSGGAWGAGLGALAPAVVQLASPYVSSAVSSLTSRLDPEGFATRKLGQLIDRSGRTAQDIEAEIAAAKAAGQNNYTPADALGKDGQAAFVGMMKQPGAARNEAADWLRARNEGLGRSARTAVDEAFDTGGNTAAQHIKTLEDSRRATTKPLYDATDANAGGVDLTDVLATLNGHLDPAGVFPGGTVSPRLSAASPGIKRAGELLSTEGLGPSTSADFALLRMRKGEIDDLIQVATREGRGQEVERLIDIKNSLNAALEIASPGYSNANTIYREMSQPINSVPVGQKAFGSGQAADNIGAFNTLTPEGQSGFRVGYADSLKGSLDGSRVPSAINETIRGGDVADEVAAFAVPGRYDAFKDFMTRARSMNKTGADSLGGSPTNELFNSQADTAIDPLGFAANLAQGRFGSALKSGVSGVWNGVTGGTGASSVRDRLIPMMLDNHIGANPAPVDLGAAYSAFQKQMADAAAAGRSASSGLLSGAATQYPSPPPLPIDPHFSGGVTFDPRGR